MAATKTRKRKSSGPSKGPRGSKLSKRTNQRRNTKSGRAKMASSSFALPKGAGSKPQLDQYRVDTKAHARNALSRVAQHGTDSDKRTVRRKVKAKYPSIGRSTTTRRNRKTPKK